MATIPTQINVPDALLPLVEHAAKQDSKTVPAVNLSIIGIRKFIKTNSGSWQEF